MKKGYSVSIDGQEVILPTLGHYVIARVEVVRTKGGGTKEELAMLGGILASLLNSISPRSKQEFCDNNGIAEVNLQ